MSHKRKTSHLPKWKPGQSGNPRGRPAAGRSIREEINCLINAGHTEKALRELADNPELPAQRVIAAQRIIRAMEWGDMADFEPLLTGAVASLAALRARGINTEVVKRFKVRTHTQKDGSKIVERDIELHDRARTEFLAIMNTTALSPAEEDKARRLDHGKATEIEAVQMSREAAFDFDNLRRTFYEAMQVDSGRHDANAKSGLELNEAIAKAKAAKPVHPKSAAPGYGYETNDD